MGNSAPGGAGHGETLIHSVKADLPNDKFDELFIEFSKFSYWTFNNFLRALAIAGILV